MKTVRRDYALAPPVEFPSYSIVANFVKIKAIDQVATCQTPNTKGVAPGHINIGELVIYSGLPPPDPSVKGIPAPNTDDTNRRAT